MKEQPIKSREIVLHSRDGVPIAGIHYDVPLPSSGIVLLHMMPAVKESYAAFARELRDAGIGVVAIDLRGHGQSQGGPEGYKAFTDQQQ